jgi:hypothetical protein
MKKIKLLVALFFGISSFQAQVVTTAPIVESLLGEMIAADAVKEADDTAFKGVVKSFEEKGIKLKEETFSEISKIQEGLEMVSGVIKSSKDVLYIQGIIKRISMLFLESTIKINKHPYVSPYDKDASYKVNTLIMNNVYDKSKELGIYLANNKLKLSDFQRLTLIKDLKSNLKGSYNQMQYFNSSIIREGNKTQRKVKVLLTFKNKDY